MVQHISGLGANRAFVLRGGGDRQFDRLLAELAGAVSGAPFEQASGVGFLRARFGATGDGLCKVVKREHNASPIVLLRRRKAGRKKGTMPRDGALVENVVRNRANHSP